MSLVVFPITQNTSIRVADHGTCESLILFTRNGFNFLGKRCFTWEPQNQLNSWNINIDTKRLTLFRHEVVHDVV